ncbi:hypothetical protein HJG53_04110 [Sphingomonas sp. ID1715]|uniref:DUF6456 domain-containing protein n=1 Tax=Sphingomonas sp. ID1715 TaxID=1656898 RepID=UPI001489107D|nr:DUF6456 domain-containing protein [Sphingomonas sp. ID1715]NNM76092.1 hypothetical protein [Sphingomonas sp. ID1715]
MVRVLAERRLKGAGNRSVTVNLAESPLAWLATRGRISDRQLLAGETLRADWERAGLAPSVTMRWEATPGGVKGGGLSPAPDPTTSQIDAKRRFDAAVAHVGTGLADVLWRVACAGEGLADTERALGWPARAGKLVLGFALDRLADFYRIR